MVITRRVVLTGALIGLVGLVSTARAHHSFSAVYDDAKPVRLDGIVAAIEWRNPHVVLSLTTVDAAGTETNWTFEMGAPRVLTMRLGWSTDSITPGDHIVVEGFLARTGDHQAAAQFVTTPSGQRLRSVLPFR